MNIVRVAYKLLVGTAYVGRNVFAWMGLMDSKSVSFLFKFSRRSAFVLLLVNLLLATVVHGQVIYGTITGNVTDISGAVVGGATVTSQNTGTGVTREVTTNNEGIYLLQ